MCNINFNYFVVKTTRFGITPCFKKPKNEIKI